jgi:CHASE3 domain sensor protein
MSGSFPHRVRNLALAGVLVFVGIIAALTWPAIRATREARDGVQHASAVPRALKDLDSAVTEADAGQLGYLLTGSLEYLSPYEAALRRVTRSKMIWCG